MPDLTFTHPREIDGDPAEVEVAVREQLGRITELYVELAAASVVQLRSSFMTRVITNEPDIDPSEIADRWEESDDRAGAMRVQALADALGRAVKAL